MESLMETQLIKQFDFGTSDVSVLANNWERWKRSIKLFIAAKEIKDPKTQQATLLHYGGALQDVFFSLPNQGTVPDGSDVFSHTLELLDAHFLPKANLAYERHVLRSLKQDAKESATQFIVKLRNQADKCGFGTDTARREEAICDQFLVGCSSDAIRKELVKKILEDGKISLDIVEKVAKATELASKQASEFKGEPTNSNLEAMIAKVDRKKSQNSSEHNCHSQRCNCKCCECRKQKERDSGTEESDGEKDGKDKGESNSCYWCGQVGHYAKSDDCPAKGKKCTRCNCE